MIPGQIIAVHEQQRVSFLGGQTEVNKCDHPILQSSCINILDTQAYLQSQNHRLNRLYIPSVRLL